MDQGAADPLPLHARANRKRSEQGDLLRTSMNTAGRKGDMTRQTLLVHRDKLQHAICENRQVTQQRNQVLIWKRLPIEAL